MKRTSCRTAGGPPVRASRVWLSAAAVASLLAVVVLASAGAKADEAGGPSRVARVFVLAGQSNMEGQAVVDLDGPDYNEGRGTLATLLRDPAQAIRFAHLRDAAGRWQTRDRVFVSYRRENEPPLEGPLGIGYAVYGGRHHFGAELQFGHVVADHAARTDGRPILLVKTAWGGKSLDRDFRPPSAGSTTDSDGRVVSAPGPSYTRMIDDVRRALADVPRLVPGADRGELAGFVWWHGWNDGCDAAVAAPAYEANLACLIRDVRHDLDAAALPVVIGELTGPWTDAPAAWDEVRRAQAAVAARPEFAETVRFVATRDFVRRPEDSPNPGHGHHEFGNAETYLLVGDALGRAMVAALSDER